MAGNPFDQFDATPAAGPVYGAPDPTMAFKARDDQRDDVRIGLEQQRLSLAQQEAAARQAKEALELGDKSTKLARAKSDTVANLTDVINKIDQVGGQARAGWLDTGRGGAFVRGLPGVLSAGTDAYNLAANLGKIDATGAFSTLQTMRENSPTGGALGAVSDTELGLLKSSVANLDPNQSEDQFLTNLSEARNVYLRMLEKVDPAAADALRKKMEQEAPPPITDEGGLEVRITDDSPGGAPTSAPTTPGGGPNSGEGGLIDLAKQGVTLGLADEAAGIGGYISGFLTGEDPQAAYVRERDAARARVNTARENNPVIGTALEFLGGGGAARVAGAGVNALGSVIRQGAALGGVGGFGYGEGSQGSVGNAFLGAGVGGAAGGALGLAGRGISALASRAGGPAPTAEQISLIQAGERQNVPVRQADVRPELRNRRADLESSQGGGAMIQRAAMDDAAAIEARALDVAGGQPFARNDPTSLGQSAQRVASRGTQAVKDSASDLYMRAERRAPDFVATPNRTFAAIDEKIAELKAASPSGYNAEVGALESMKSDLQQTGLSVKSLQAQKETLGGRIGDNMQDRSRADRIFTQVLNVAGEELQSGLSAADPQAAALLKRANAKYGQYKRTQREVEGLFLGKRGDATAESAARQLNSIASRNSSAMRRFATMATPEEKADFAATFMQEWGSTARGDFSPANFAKNVGNVSDRTLVSLLGRDGRNAVRDLQMLANAKTDAASRTAPSGAAISGAGRGLKGLILGALGLTGGGPVGAIAVPVAGNVIAQLGEKRAARMLLNPDFTKWLRSIPNSNNPRVIDRYFSRLAGISSIASNDNQAFVSAVRNSVSQSPGRAAAQDESDTRREPVQ